MPGDKTKKLDIVSFKDVAKFHGHECPGLALGYRAAEAGMDKLLAGRSGDEELVAIVENDSCSTDAIQVVTGCTFGKGNFFFRDYGKHVYTFINRVTGDAVRVSLKPGFSFEKIEPKMSRLRQKVMSGKAGVEEAIEFDKIKDKVVKKILSMPIEDVFIIKSVKVKEPKEAKLFSTIECAVCGEGVAEHRARIKGGKVVCIPCCDKK